MYGMHKRLVLLGLVLLQNVGSLHAMEKKRERSASPAATALALDVVAPALKKRKLPAWMLPGATTTTIAAAPVAPVPSYETFFNQIPRPNDTNGPIHDALTEVIDGEYEEIRIAIYTLTSKTIVAKLIEALKEGVEVQVVGDGHQMERATTSPEAYNALRNNGASVWRYSNRGYNLLHHKFLLGAKNNCANGGCVVWDGTFNFTDNATRSEENATRFLNDRELYEKFVERHEEIKTRSDKVTAPLMPVPARQYIRPTPSVTPFNTPCATPSKQMSLANMLGIKKEDEFD